MAIREYVGARYVPRISKNGLLHNSANTYEALDLVQNENGTTYLSVRPVPSGIELNNTNYWILTAVTNSQLEQVLTDLSSIQSEINKVAKTGNYLIIGDDYALINESWTDKIQKMIIPSYGKLTVVAKNGAGFGTTTNNFYELINNAYSEIQNANEIEAVIFAGGLNDLKNKNLYGSISSTIQRTKNLFQNANIYVAMICHCKNLSESGYIHFDFGRTIEQYRRCVDDGASYLTGTEWALHVKNRFSTNILPNEAGSTEIARAISQTLHGGYYTPYGQLREFDATPYSWASNSTNIRFNEQMSGDGVDIEIVNIDIMRADGSAINISNEQIDIGIVEGNMFFNGDDNTGIGYATPVDVRLQFTNDTSQNVPAILRFALNTTTHQQIARLIFEIGYGNVKTIHLKAQNIFHLSLMRS